MELDDNIDEPIRNILIKMNELEYSTISSCCGYNYDGQKEDKKHSNAMDGGLGPHIEFLSSFEKVIELTSIIASIFNHCITPFQIIYIGNLTIFTDWDKLEKIEEEIKEYDRWVITTKYPKCWKILDESLDILVELKQELW